jgi:hypothetical protein
VLSVVGIVYGAMMCPRQRRREEAHRLQLGEPPRLLHAGHLRPHGRGRRRQRLPDAEPRRVARARCSASSASSTSGGTPGRSSSTAASPGACRCSPRCS